MLVLRTEVLSTENTFLSRCSESRWLLIPFVSQPVRRLLEPGGVVRHQRKVEEKASGQNLRLQQGWTGGGPSAARNPRRNSNW